MPCRAALEDPASLKRSPNTMSSRQTPCTLILLVSLVMAARAFAEEQAAPSEGGFEDRALGRYVPLEDGSGRALERFHKAIRRAELGKGRARILFYGDSHVARDRYTGMLRQSLQERFGDSGSGFVPLAEPFDWYRHHDVTVSDIGSWKRLRVKGAHRPRDAYGLFGIALESSVEAVSFVAPRKSSGRGSRSNRLDLYFWRQKGGGTLEVSVDGGAPISISTDAPSPRADFERLKVRDGQHRLQVRAKGDGPVKVFGVSLERMRPGVIIDAIGIPGACARDQLPSEKRTQITHLRRLGPDLVVLSYGTNESSNLRYSMSLYERELREVIGRVRRALPSSSCLLIGPSELPLRQADGSWAPREITGQIIEVQRRLAVEAGCAFFDQLTFMGGPGSMSRWVEHEPPLARGDYTHYTREGHQRLAEVLERALLEGL